MLAQSLKAVAIKSVVCEAYGERLESKEKLLRRWDAEACKQSQGVDRLRAEAEVLQNRLKLMMASVQVCAKRLAKLSSPPRKAQKGTYPHQACPRL